MQIEQDVPVELNEDEINEVAGGQINGNATGIGVKG